MLKDRGNIKWTAMMLPEHVSMIRELKERQNYKTKPIIDEQRLEEFNEIIHFSLQTREAVQLKYFKSGDYRSVIGVIDHVDHSLTSIKVVIEDGSKVQIFLENIIDMKSVD